MPQMTAASFPLTVDGQEYQMTPLTDRDFDELTNWLRSRVIDTARKSLTDDMDPEERREVIAAAVETASGINFGEPRSQQHVKTVDGVARVIYQGCLKRHPNLNFETFRKAFRKKGVIETTMAVWKELNLPKKREDAGGDQGESAGGEEVQAPVEPANA